ncbi:MAG: hypothetical protein IPK66_11100 [Rhodospirillales bacterium]|nr:hypothetical protein [Rhodospirillales bacterium]
MSESRTRQAGIPATPHHAGPPGQRQGRPGADLGHGRHRAARPGSSAALVASFAAAVLAASVLAALWALPAAADSLTRNPPPAMLAPPPVKPPVSPLVSPPAVPLSNPAGESPRERTLLDQQRQVEGQIRTLDRQLGPYEIERLRRPPPNAPHRMTYDPLQERREGERRGLELRSRMIEQDLRHEQFEQDLHRSPRW